MDVKEVQKRKRNLEDTIQNLLNDFLDETGCYFDGIDISTIPINSSGIDMGKPKCKVYDVLLDIMV